MVRKIAFSCILAVCVVLSIIPVSFAEEVTTVPNLATFHFPEPSTPWVSNRSYLTTIRCLTPVNTVSGTGSTNGSSFSFTSGYANPITMRYDETNYRVYFMLYNLYNISLDFIYSTYNTNGVLQYSFKVSVPANQQREYYTTLNLTRGVSYSEESVTFDDSISSFNLVPISFSNDLDYTNDFVKIENTLSNITSLLNNIITQDSSYYNVVTQFINDFFMIDADDSNGHTWDEYINNIEDIDKDLEYFISQFQWWYTYEFRAQMEQVNHILWLIYDLLDGSQTETTFPPETVISNAVDEYNSVEHGIMNDPDVSGYGDVVSDQFADAEEIFDDNRGVGTAFQFIMSNIGWLIEKPFMTILVTFSLSIGLVIFVLGRKVH